MRPTLPSREASNDKDVTRTFLPAPSPLAFWARRQAHETGIHRADVESPGGRITPFPAQFAVDGVEELLFGFLRGPSDELDPSPRALQLQAVDTPGESLLRIGAESLVARQGHGRADCSVRGSASDLYLLLWNRLVPDGLDVSGDASVLSLWRETVQIHWSRAR